MNVKTWILLGTMSAVLGGLLTYKNLAKQDEITIGILQTASHPALDEARKGFITEMNRLMNGKIRYVVQNAEGSLTSAQSIASSFHAHQKIQAIYAIATPAVQAAARVEKEKPIFIAAVTDPYALGIVHEKTNICGTTDRVDTEAQAELILNLTPFVKTVAILYNPQESNSQATVVKMQESLQVRGLNIVLLGVHSEAEIVSSVAVASRKAQLILVPADNLLVGAMPLLAKEALKAKIPLVASDIPSVAKGALAAQGADYTELGKLTAQKAYQVLGLKEHPATVGIQDPTQTKILVNTTAENILGVIVPEKLAAYVVFVE